MYKCKQCGAEFEGKFCPECGTRREENKTCPKCGALLAAPARFCSECGYDFNATAEEQNSATENTENSPAGEAAATVATAEQRPAAQPQRPVGAYGTGTERPQTAAMQAGAPSGFMKKIYPVMRILPSLLLAALSVLCLLFFIADAGAVSAMGHSEGLGSVYSLISGSQNDMKGVLTALLAADIVAFVCAAVGMLFAFLPQFKDKALNIAKNKILLCDVLSCVAAVVCLVIFIIACVACGSASGLLGGAEAMLGMSSGPAAGVILPLVFSVIFMIVIALCPVARWLLGKKYPELPAEEEKKFEEGLKRRRKAAGKSADSSELTVDGQMRTLKNIRSLVRRMKMLKATFITLGTFVLPIMCLSVFVVPFIGLGAKYEDWVPKNLEGQRKSLRTYTIIYGILGVIMTVFLIVFEVVLFPKLILLMPLPPTFSWVYGLLGGFIWLFALTLILALLLCVVTYPTLVRLEEVFYGEKKPAAYLMAPKYDVNTFFVNRSKIEHKEITGKKPAPDVIRLAHTLLLVAAVLIVALVHTFSGRNFIFTNGYYDKVELGTKDYYDLRTYLGQYDDPSGYTSSSKVENYYYYSENFRTLNYNYNQKMNEMMYALEHSQRYDDSIEREISKLVYEMSNINFSYIYVHFGSNGVDSVVMCPNAIYDSHSGGVRPAEDDRTFSNAEVCNILGTSGERYSAKVWFSDGSYHYTYITPTITPLSLNSSRCRLSWTDSYFNVQIETIIDISYRM